MIIHSHYANDQKINLCFSFMWVITIIWKWICLLMFLQVLDFDFEKFCSVSLSNLNVYACLVCGKYYQGRGQKSHAYTHSLEAGHHVYINLRTEKVYCLPDGYEINDPSLDDIRHVLNPRFNCFYLHLSIMWFVLVHSWFWNYLREKEGWIGLPSDIYFNF